MMRMADHGTRPPERQRLRKLAQAALNADMTVDQVETILVDLSEVLGGMDSTIGSLDTTLGTFDGSLTRLSGTLERVDGMADQLDTMLNRLEGIVDRVERLVGIAEAALSPIGAIETAGRGLLGALGLKGR